VVIVGRTPDGDYKAVSKADDTTLFFDNVKEKVQDIKGTEILIYTEGP
jgi:hypothetical protein